MKSLGFVLTYLRNNFATALEYRFSFVSQILGMMINDSLWVIFWVLYFQKFPVVNGWGLNDLLLMWATITFSFGLAFGLFANVSRLPELILQGQLDYYLALPKNVLLHLSVSNIRPVNLGDCLFGPLLLFFFVPLDFTQVLLFLAGSVLAAVVYYSFYLLAGSLTFFLASSEGLAANMAMALVHFSTYPTRIFDGWARVLLFTVIPAGFISEVPVELVRNFDPKLLGELVLAAGAFFAFAVTVFHLGLRRYESGNLLQMRS